jgi:hypothetical protein
MSVVLVYLRLYGSCLANALAALAKNLWTLLLPVGLAVAWYALGFVVVSLRTGIVGGFALALARTAGFSVYTYFLAGVVAKERVNLSELKTSLGAYFWSWMNVFFVLWIVELLLGLALASNPQRDALLRVVSLMELIALNATPEVVYLKRTGGGVETIQRSFQFLQENWIEWFVPNGLLIGAWFAASVYGLLPMLGALGGLAAAALFAALLHLLMVFRGFLFEALDGSTHRQRMFRYRGAGSAS